MDSKVVLITAAGSGMGAEVARLLAEKKYRIGILSSSGKGEALANELGGVGVTGSNLNVDDLERFVGTVKSAYGRIDYLINSAGHGAKGKLLELTDDDWHQAMNVYLMNVIRMCRLITPSLVKVGGGAIVNISSFATFEPDPRFPTSSVFRAGLASFTKLYSNEYASRNIRMNNILPGFVDSKPENEQIRQSIPMQRYGTMTEIAQTAAFLISDGAAYIAGQNIRVDGGLTRSV